jgi:hypothetical protein
MAVRRNGLLVLFASLTLISCAHPTERAVTAPDVSRLSSEFARLAVAATASDWKEVFRLLPAAQRRAGGIDAFVATQEESRYRLRALGTPSMKKMDQDAGWWVISSCGLFEHDDARVELMADTEAVWEGGRWVFTGPLIRAALDGLPQQCTLTGVGPQGQRPGTPE